MKSSQDLHALERLRPFAPAQISRTALELLDRRRCPADARGRLVALSEPPSGERRGYLFPIVAIGALRRYVMGGVVSAFSAKGDLAGSAAGSPRPLLNAEEPLLDHFERRAAGRGHGLYVEPSPALGAGELSVGGGSWALAFAMADLAAEHGWTALGYTALSGALEWAAGRLIAKVVDEVEDKVKILEAELPSRRRMFVCCKRDDPRLSLDWVEWIAPGTQVAEVFDRVRTFEQAERSASAERARFGRSPGAPAKSVPELQAALALRVENEPAPDRAFQVRLVIPIAFDAAQLVPLMANGGWRLARVKAAHSWFGRMSLGALGQWSRPLLSWVDTAAPASPAVLLMEMSRLSRARVEAGEGTAGIGLESVDLVPFAPAPGTTRAEAALGLVFSGGERTLGDVLRFSGARADLFSVRLLLGGGPLQRVLSIKELVAEIEKSVLAGRRPALDAVEKTAASYPFPLVWQTIHFPLAVWPEQQTEEQADVLRLAWDLASTISMPKPGYPKDLDRRREPETELTERTRYAVHDKGATFLVGATPGGFNEGTKPRVLMETHYLQWILAQRHVLVQEGRPLARHLIQQTFGEEHHRGYYEFCESWHRRAKPG